MFLVCENRSKPAFSPEFAASGTGPRLFPARWPSEALGSRATSSEGHPTELHRDGRTLFPISCSLVTLRCVRPRGRWQSNRVQILFGKTPCRWSLELPGWSSFLQFSCRRSMPVIGLRFWGRTETASQRAKSCCLNGRKLAPLLNGLPTLARGLQALRLRTTERFYFTARSRTKWFGRWTPRPVRRFGRVSSRVRMNPACPAIPDRAVCH